MQSILVGVDRSAASRRAVELAVRQACSTGWDVTVAHVINWSRYSPTTPQMNEMRSLTRRREIETAREQIVDPLVDWATSEGGIPPDRVTSVIRHGRPSEVLVDIARRSRHDLIIVGRTGESQLKMAVFGSTPNRLVQHAPVPVVVVP